MYVYLYVCLSTLSRPNQWTNLNKTWYTKASTPGTLHWHLFGKGQTKRPKNSFSMKLAIQRHLYMGHGVDTKPKVIERP